MHTYCSLETVGINSELWNCPTNFISMDHENQVGELKNMCLKKERKGGHALWHRNKSTSSFLHILLLLFKLLVFCLAVIAQGLVCLCPLLSFSTQKVLKWMEMDLEKDLECFVLSIGVKWLQSIWNVGVAVWLTCFVCSLCACDVINLQSNATPELNGTPWQIQ